MSNRVQQALDTFEHGYNCSQAVLLPFASSFGLSDELAAKVSGAFGGGMARSGERCGALTGAMMVLGLAHASTVPNAEFKAKTYELTERLVAAFKQRNGCTDCKALIGFDLSTEEGRRLASEHNTHHRVCPKFVRDAAEILETLI